MSHDPVSPVPPSGPRTASRRSFLRTLGVASATLPFLPVLPGMAQTAPPAGGAPTTPPAAAGAADSEFAADARSLADMVERRYGSRMTAAEKDAVRADLQDGLEGGSALRKLELGNADEPDAIFQARALED